MLVDLGWCDYPAESNAIIVAAAAAAATESGPVRITVHGVAYNLDFETMRQVRADDDARWRRIRFDTGLTWLEHGANYQPYPVGGGSRAVYAWRAHGNPKSGEVGVLRDTLTRLSPQPVPARDGAAPTSSFQAEWHHLARATTTPDVDAPGGGGGGGGAGGGEGGSSGGGPPHIYTRAPKAPYEQYLAQTEQFSHPDKACNVTIYSGDWGETCQALTVVHGKRFAVLNMANAFGKGGG